MKMNLNNAGSSGERDGKEALEGISMFIYLPHNLMSSSLSDTFRVRSRTTILLFLRLITNIIPDFSPLKYNLGIFICLSPLKTIQNGNSRRLNIENRQIENYVLLVSTVTQTWCILVIGHLL